MVEETAMNTDRELWRETEGDYYASSIHVTAGGSICINVGGRMICQTLAKWHAFAASVAYRENHLAPLDLDARAREMLAAEIPASHGQIGSAYKAVWIEPALRAIKAALAERPVVDRFSPEEKVALWQARYALRDFNRKQPGCGFDKLAEFLGDLALLQPGAVSVERGEDIDDLWDEILGMDDRTSPEEYPNHALITYDEFKEFCLRASLNRDREG